jgi:hypothetical protein
VVAGGEGELARKEQRTRGNLARGDVMVGVDRRSSTTAMVFRCGGSPAVDRR